VCPDVGGAGTTLVGVGVSPQGSVKLSAVDWSGMKEDQKTYRISFGDIEFISLVFNQECTSFDGYQVCPEGFYPVDEIVVIRDCFSKLYRKKTEISGQQKSLYSRMVLIPEFDCNKAANLKIGIVGLGGLGASLLQSVILLGLGENEELILIDHDHIDDLSNLSRIPFASFKDLDRAKVEVAKDYIISIRPERKVFAFVGRCDDQEAQSKLVGCDLILNAVDSELARFVVNHISTNFLIPVLDNGGGIIIDEFNEEQITFSGGQARLYVPGFTPCFLCNLGIDGEEVTREAVKMFMDEGEKATIKRAGYLEDLNGGDAPQPSIYNLGQILANLGIGFLLDYLLRDENKDGFNTVHFDLENYEIKKIKAKKVINCPFCGDRGSLAGGQFFNINDFKDTKIKKEIPIPGFKKREKSEA